MFLPRNQVFRQSLTLSCDQISSQSLNGHNSASRRAREVPKKGKSSEFNPRNYEQVQSSPSQKVWSHKSIKDAVKLPKNLISSQKRKIFKNTKKMLGPKQKYFQGLTDIISSEQLRKLEKIQPFGHSKASKIKKKCHILLIFPVLGNLTHMFMFW